MMLDADLDLLIPEAPPDPLVKPRWGTVTEVTPALMVRRDGETTGVKAVSGVAGLAVNDRVWTVLSGGQLIVVLRYDGTPPADEVGGMVAAATWYRKSPGGDLWCRGRYSFPSASGNTKDYTWTYPVPFVGENPIVAGVANSSAPELFTSVSISGNSTTGVTLYFRRNSAASTTVDFEARGRWK